MQKAVFRVKQQWEFQHCLLGRDCHHKVDWVMLMKSKSAPSVRAKQRALCLCHFCLCKVGDSTLFSGQYFVSHLSTLTLFLPLLQNNLGYVLVSVLVTVSEAGAK